MGDFRKYKFKAKRAVHKNNNYKKASGVLGDEPKQTRLSSFAVSAYGELEAYGEI